MKIECKSYGGAAMYYRPGSSDESVIREVLEQHVYRRVSAKFDVEAGEKWLDLGGNIGAFAAYATLRGAAVTSYEPDPGNFELLTKNSSGLCIRAAVTMSKRHTAEFYAPDNPNRFSRGSTVRRTIGAHLISVPNVCANTLLKAPYTGVKMDIEGGEMEMLDAGWLPRSVCKLVVEYHTSVDSSLDNFFRRIDWLRSKFNRVVYRPQFDTARAAGLTELRQVFDKNIFAWDRK
jgi:FkbM family methyltransferase